MTFSLVIEKKIGEMKQMIPWPVVSILVLIHMNPVELKLSSDRPTKIPIITSTPCRHGSSNVVFKSPGNDPRAFMRCGPSGTFWIYHCDAGQRFSPGLRRCVSAKIFRATKENAKQFSQLSEDDGTPATLPPHIEKQRYGGSTTHRVSNSEGLTERLQHLHLRYVHQPSAKRPSVTKGLQNTRSRSTAGGTLIYNPKSGGQWFQGPQPFRQPSSIGPLTTLVQWDQGNRNSPNFANQHLPVGQPHYVAQTYPGNPPPNMHQDHIQQPHWNPSIPQPQFPPPVDHISNGRVPHMILDRNGNLVRVLWLPPDNKIVRGGIMAVPASSSTHGQGAVGHTAGALPVNPIGWQPRPQLIGKPAVSNDLYPTVGRPTAPISKPNIPTASAGQTTRTGQFPLKIELLYDCSRGKSCTYSPQAIRLCPDMTSRRHFYSCGYNGWVRQTCPEGLSFTGEGCDVIPASSLNQQYGMTGSASGAAPTVGTPNTYNPVQSINQGIQPPPYLGTLASPYVPRIPSSHIPTQGVGTNSVMGSPAGQGYTAIQPHQPHSPFGSAGSTYGGTGYLPKYPDMTQSQPYMGTGNIGNTYSSQTAPASSNLRIKNGHYPTYPKRIRRPTIRKTRHGKRHRLVKSKVIELARKSNVTSSSAAIPSQIGVHDTRVAETDTYGSAPSRPGRYNISESFTAAPGLEPSELFSLRPLLEDPCELSSDGLTTMGRRSWPDYEDRRRYFKCLPLSRRPLVSARGIWTLLDCPHGQMYNILKQLCERRTIPNQTNKS